MTTYPHRVDNYGHFAYTANMCMENTMKSCIFEIPQKVVFFEIFLHWLKCTNFSLYDFKNYFQKYNWKYHLYAVLGTVINAQRALEVHGKHYTTKIVFFYSQYLQCTLFTWHDVDFFLRDTYLTILVHVVIEWPLQWNFSCAENVVAIYKQINTINILEENYAFFINTLLQFCTIPSVQSSSKAY